MGCAMQTQNDRVGLESVGCLQDLLTRRSELDGKFRFHYQLGLLGRQFLESPEAGHTNILSHLHDIASGGQKVIPRDRDIRDNVEQNELCSEVVGGRDGVWQGMQGGFAEVRSEQKGSNGSSAPDWGILKGTRTNGQNQAIGVTKDAFCH